MSQYKTIDDIPHHMFWDTLLTQPVTDELAKYLRYMYENHQDSLKYLHRRCQQYKEYGGAYQVGFQQWLNRLNKELNKRGY